MYIAGLLLSKVRAHYSSNCTLLRVLVYILLVYCYLIKGPCIGLVSLSFIKGSCGPYYGFLNIAGSLSLIKGALCTLLLSLYISYLSVKRDTWYAGAKNNAIRELTPVLNKYIKTIWKRVVIIGVLRHKQRVKRMGNTRLRTGILCSFMHPHSVW